MIIEELFISLLKQAKDFFVIQYLKQIFHKVKDVLLNIHQ